MKSPIVITLACLAFLGACSPGGTDKKAADSSLREFSKSRDTQLKIARLRDKSQKAPVSPALKALSDLNGRWRSADVSPGRHLEISFGMDAVVVLDLMSENGSVASSQGKLVLRRDGTADVALASPRPVLKAYSSFSLTGTGSAPVMVAGDAKMRLSRM